VVGNPEKVPYLVASTPHTFRATSVVPKEEKAWRGWRESARKSLHVDDLITWKIGDSSPFSNRYRVSRDKCWYRQSHIDPENFFVNTEIKS
jgi:hypothetical protein